jgi:hypothetical protein
MPAILFNTKLIWIFFGSFPRYTPQKSSSLSWCEIFSMPPPHFSGSRGWKCGYGCRSKYFLHRNILKWCFFILKNHF